MLEVRGALTAHHTLSSQRRFTGFTGIYQALQLQEISFSEAEVEEEAEGKKEATAPHFVNQAANSSN